MVYYMPLMGLALMRSFLYIYEGLTPDSDGYYWIVRTFDDLPGWRQWDLSRQDTQ
jgi:hypothetical protein